MPLFGNNNATTTGAGANDPAYNGTTNNTTGHHGHTGPGPVIGGAAGGALGHHEGHTGVGTALGAAAGHHHANTHPDANTTTTTGHHGHTGPGPVVGGAAGGMGGHLAGHTAAGTVLGAAAGEHHAHTHPNAPVAGTGAGMGAGTGAGMGAGTGAGMGAGTGARAGAPGAGASEKAFVGKLEHAAGSLLCSTTLKAKGLEKEREAQALKVQSAELGQAEGLESQAAARRERAVAHGAHPHHLGGGAGTTGTV